MKESNILSPNSSKARIWPVVVRPWRRTKLRMARRGVPSAEAPEAVDKAGVVAGGVTEGVVVVSVTRGIVGLRPAFHGTILPRCHPGRQGFAHRLITCSLQTQGLGRLVQGSQRIGQIQRGGAILFG